MKYDLREKLESLKNRGFDTSQISAIRFAMGQVGVNEDLISNTDISSDYMLMYIDLMKKGIDVTKYVRKHWKLKETPVNDLEDAILAENNYKIDIQDSTVTEVEPITDIKNATINIIEPNDIRLATITESKPKTQPKQRILRRNIK